MIESYTDLKAGTFFLNTVRSKMCWTKTHFLWFCLCAPQWILNGKNHHLTEVQIFSFNSRGLKNYCSSYLGIIAIFIHGTPFSKAPN